MPGRSYTADSYRYGFQGQETDGELWGGAVSYKYRTEDARLGRFFSVDPLTAEYPHYTPYSFSGNKTIHAVELEGLEEAIVIRYYDNNNNWTGSTVINVVNVNDRPLGNTGILYINQQGNPGRANNIERQLRGLSRTNPPQNLLGNFLNSANNGVANRPANGGNANQNTLINGVAFFRNRVDANNASVNAQENAAINSNNLQMQGNNNVVTSRLTIVNYTIEYPYASANSNPGDDIDGDGVTNQQNLNRATNGINNNPDRVGTIVGNSSTEDSTGNNNQPLSQQRANALTNQLLQNGANQNQIINAGGQGAANPVSNQANQNTANTPSINRRATVTTTYPRQNQ